LSTPSRPARLICESFAFVHLCILAGQFVGEIRQYAHMSLILDVDLVSPRQHFVQQTL
jgi:hypothetical protein